jgi:hypothetical protein
MGFTGRREVKKIVDLFLPVFPPSCSRWFLLAPRVTSDGRVALGVVLARVAMDNLHCGGKHALAREDLAIVGRGRNDGADLICEHREGQEPQLGGELR